MKKKFLHSTRKWVLMYSIFYMVLTLFYCSPRLLVSVLSPEHLNRTVQWLCNDATAGIPLDIFAWGLFIISAAYCGLDRSIFAVRSSMMEMGTCDMGNPSKVRHVIYLMFTIFLETVTLNYLLGADVNISFTDNSGQLITNTYNGIHLPLDQVSSALVSVIVCYVAGNKAIKVTQQVDATGGDHTPQPWADEKEQKVVVDDQ